MTHSHEIQNKEQTMASAFRWMALGAGIALAVILMFTTGAEEHPSWPELWMLKPLILTPIIGALGGLVPFAFSGMRSRGGWLQIVAVLLSLIGYCIVLWLGTVLGLNGTLWD